MGGGGPVGSSEAGFVFAGWGFGAALFGQPRRETYGSFRVRFSAGPVPLFVPPQHIPCLVIGTQKHVASRIAGVLPETK